jgi:hypothetical protein
MKKPHAEVSTAIEREGAVAGPDHVEIYLNDPRRTQPQKMRTVLLLGVAKRQRGAVQAREMPARKPATQDLRLPPRVNGRPLVR